MAFLAAALPLIVAALAIFVRAPAIDWTGDRALTELGVRGVVHGQQLLGIGGRFGWRHPGPLWLQLLVPAYEATGHAPWALSVGAIAVHIAMVAVAVAAATRAAGALGAAVLAAAVALYLRATGMLYWTNLWAGYAFTWPLLAMIVVGAVATSGRKDSWALPAAVLLGTLLVQTDVSTAVPVVLVLAAVIALRVARTRTAFLRGATGAPVALGAAALIVLVILAWVPPIIQQATKNPGNITLLVRYARTGAGGQPLRLATAAVGAALSVFPGGARWVLRPGVQEHLGAGPWWAIAITACALVATVGVAVVGWRRQRVFAADLALLSAIGVVAALISMSRVDGQLNFYLLTWVSVLPVTAVTAAVVVIAPASGRDRAFVAALAIAAVVGVTMATLHGTEHDWDRRASADVAAQTVLTRQALGSSVHRLVLVHVVTSDTWPYAAGVADQLERHGARVEVDPGWVFLFGDAYAPKAAPPSAEVWFARPHEAPVLRGVPGALDLGSVDGVDVYARQD